MSDKFTLDVRQASELSFAFERNGWTTADVKTISSGDLLARLLPVIRGLAEVSVVQHIINCDTDPLIPYDDWKVEEHQKRGQFTWDPTKVKHYRSKNQMNGKWLEGNKLRKELADQPTFNANLLDYLLEHPHLIPEAWKKDEEGNMLYTFFWATIYRSADGDLYVRCLDFDGGHWRAGYCWLDYDFDAYDPAAVRAS